MSIKLSHPTKKIKGSINLTSSKSESNRVLIIQAFCQNKFEIKNLAEAKDTTTLKRLLKLQNNILDVGHAGTVMRFLTAYLCLQKGSYTLTGSVRMKQRPVKILVETLQNLGAKIEYLENEGFPPLKITGSKMEGGEIKIDGSVSSQYISALLLIAPQLEKGLKLHFIGEVVSRPYINMTIAIMKHYGIDINWSDEVITVQKGGYKAKDITIEADWSSASYWYSIIANSELGTIDLLGLRKDSLQGDAVVSNLYRRFGVNTEYIKNGIRLTKQTVLSDLGTKPEVNFENCPDIAQTYAITCASLGAEVRLTGLKTLRIKETDRIFALKTELSKLGFDIRVEEDDLIILAPRNLMDKSIDSRVETYDDHRMAMAFAPFALKREINIEDEHVVVKSYPAFWEDLKKVGFLVS